MRSVPRTQRSENRVSGTCETPQFVELSDGFETQDDSPKAA